MTLKCLVKQNTECLNIPTKTKENVCAENWGRVRN